MSGHCEPGSNGNEEVLRIPQSSSITGTSPSDCLVSYQDTHWAGAGSYSYAEVLSVYSTAPADWAMKLFEIELFDHLTVCKQITDV